MTERLETYAEESYKKQVELDETKKRLLEIEEKLEKGELDPEVAKRTLAEEDAKYFFESIKKREFSTKDAPEGYLARVTEANLAYTKGEKLARPISTYNPNDSLVLPGSGMGDIVRDAILSTPIMSLIWKGVLTGQSTSAYVDPSDYRPPDKKQGQGPQGDYGITTGKVDFVAEGMATNLRLPVEVMMLNTVDLNAVMRDIGDAFARQAATRVLQGSASANTRGLMKGTESTADKAPLGSVRTITSKTADTVTNEDVIRTIQDVAYRYDNISVLINPVALTNLVLQEDTTKRPLSSGASISFSSSPAIQGMTIVGKPVYPSRDVEGFNQAGVGQSGQITALAADFSRFGRVYDLPALHVLPNNGQGMMVWEVTKLMASNLFQTDAGTYLKVK